MRGKQPVDISGKRYESLLVQSYVGRGRWQCICDCGTPVQVLTYNLNNGHTKSCGCLRAIRAVSLRTTHGKRHSRVYNIWCHMIARCGRKSDRDYKNYGARGIKVCDRWHSFENFYADMGDPPIGMSIERIDNDGNYEPHNCKWATKLEQCRNRRVNHVISAFGQEMCMSAWAEELNISRATIKTRYQRGDRGERLLRPVQR